MSAGHGRIQLNQTVQSQGNEGFGTEHINSRCSVMGVEIGGCGEVRTYAARTVC